MDLTILVSLLNAGTLSIAGLGCLMFIITPAYRGICVLLALVSLAAAINLLEDLHISRELHLISPIFVLGYGPALYLAVKRLISGSMEPNSLWHFLPMFLLLPFTTHVQTVIALGSLWRVAYALLTLKLIIEFNRQLPMQRSDATEVSLSWLGWLIGTSTLFSVFDLVRLNFQPELGPYLNMIGYAASSFVFFIVILLLVWILNNRRTELETIAESVIVAPPLTNTTLFNTDSIHVSTANSSNKRTTESAADYQSLFVILDREIRTQKWYCQPRLSLNQLSDLSGMTPRDISRSINLVADMSFNDYINHHRIDQIKFALQTDNSTNITDLALAAGFSSKATFNQSFKKATGMTPSEFRQMKLAQQVQNHASSQLISSD